MSDFHQTGIVATLHRLKNRPIEELEADISEFSASSPIALILPSLFSELQGPALPGIVEELRHVPYLETIIVPIGRASAEEFEGKLRDRDPCARKGDRGAVQRPAPPLLRNGRGGGGENLGAEG